MGGLAVLPSFDPNDPRFKMIADPSALQPVRTVGPLAGTPLRAIPQTGADPAASQLVAMPSQSLQRLPGPQLVPPPAAVPNLNPNPAPPDLPAAAAPNVGLPSWAPASRLQADQGELQRLQSTGSGVSSIRNPWLRGFAQVGDAALSAVAPGLAMLSPGTTLHNRLLQRQATGRIAEDQGELGDASKLAEQQAQTTLLDAQPQLKQMAAENTALKTQGQLQHWDAQNQRYGDQTSANLAEHGYKQDANGNLVPMAYEEMSPQMQAIEDLKHSQAEQADATAALRKAQNDPSSPAYQLAKQRLAVAQQNAQTAVGRLGLSREQYNMHAYGVGADGQALPGAMLLPDGTPVGSVNASNVRPTGQERNKADMASSAAEQINAMRQIVHNRQDIFGPVDGRTTDFSVWLGSQDPDAQRFRAARTIAGDHLAGTFGGRSAEALHAIDNAIGQFKDNPAAVDAGLQQLAGANNRFIQAGTVRTAPGRSAPPPAATGGSGGDAGIPPAAAAQLQEGVIHTFGNGQQWTKQNGKSVRIK